MNPSNPLTKRRIGLIRAAILFKRLDCKEIAAATFTSEAHVIKLMKNLHEVQKCVRITKWKLCGRTYAAVYAWGAGEDAPRPIPMTSTEGQRLFRERVRSDPEANDFYLARQRAKYREACAKSKPKTWYAALEVSHA